MPFLSKDIFSPILTGAGPVETENHFWRLIHGCDFSGPALNALLAARETGLVRKIEGLEGRDFPEAVWMNHLIEHGTEGLSEIQIKMAVSPISDRIQEIAQNALSKIASRDGYLLDTSRFASVMGAARRKMEAFLVEPNLYRREHTFPRSTQYVDRALLEQTREVRMHLLQFNGWDIQFFERMQSENWKRVESQLENELSPAS